MAQNDNVIPFPGNEPSEPSDPTEPVDARALAHHLMDRLGGPHEAYAAVQQLMAGFAPDLTAFVRPAPVLLPRRDERSCFVVRIDLDGAQPPIWRRLRLASSLPLTTLHDVLQLAMGWTDSHLHHFQMGPDTRDVRMQPFLTDFDVEEGEDEGIREQQVRLDEVLATPGHRLYYEYDFGDGWDHTIRLEKVGPWRDGDPDAVCVTGRRACPPEDVGGIHGYAEVLSALEGDLGEDPEWMREKLAWLPEGFDPAAFDVDEVNELLRAAPLPDLTRWHPAVAQLLLHTGGSALSPVRDLVGRATAEQPEAADAPLTDAALTDAVRRYARLLEAVGDGLTLTAAGYLPPRVVEDIYTDLGLSADWIGKGNREDQTWPVLALRESAISLGLLRKAKGRLLPTRAGLSVGTQPAALFAHIRDRLPLGRPHERDAGMLALLHAASGLALWEHRADAGAALASLDWRISGGDLTTAAWHWSAPTRVVIDHLTQDRGAAAPEAIRIARALLAR